MTHDAPISRPTEMEVNLDAIIHNVRVVRKHVAPAKVMIVVKANAYGHGLVEVATLLEREGVDAFGVALVEEGIVLRNAGITIPILVFGGMLGGQIRNYIDYNLDITASSVGKLEAIDATAKAIGSRARVHLKIDTGMGRIGVQYYNARGLIEAASRCSHSDIVGMFSHFATAEEGDTSFAKEQLSRFNEVLNILSDFPNVKPLRHMANSAAALAFPESRFDMIRTGLLAYGIAPAPHLKVLLPLRPAISLKTKVVYFKVLPPGAGVSYGRTWICDRESRIVTLPVGYGDGFLRALSNCGEVLIRGKRYPIVGKICMDQMMVNVGQGEAYNGDEVVLIGRQGSEEITVSEIAERAGTVEHEVLTSTNLRVPRRYRGG